MHSRALPPVRTVPRARYEGPEQRQCQDFGIDPKPSARISQYSTINDRRTCRREDTSEATRGLARNGRRSEISGSHSTRSAQVRQLGVRVAESRQWRRVQLEGPAVEEPSPGWCSLSHPTGDRSAAVGVHPPASRPLVMYRHRVRIGFRGGGQVSTWSEVSLVRGPGSVVVRRLHVRSHRTMADILCQRCRCTSAAPTADVSRG